MSLEDSIKSFLEYQRELYRSKYKSIYKPVIPDGDGRTEEFVNLKLYNQNLLEENTYPSSVGKLPANIGKNRFKDICPYDYNRVIIEDDPSFYINASKIKGVGYTNYIAAQGPLPKTVKDFWRMIIETNAETIIMACNETENNKPKCCRYWPLDVGETLMYDDVGISVTLNVEEELNDEILVRDLLVQYSGNERVIRQYHYIAWPDHGVPTKFRPILELVEAVHNRHFETERNPIVVHCSAGCGRTGAVIAIDYCWKLLYSSAPFPSNFSIYEIIKSMREQRQSLVQTWDQYNFVHESVEYIYKQHLRKMKDNVYENKEFDRIHSAKVSTSSNDDEYMNIADMKNKPTETRETKKDLKPPIPVITKAKKPPKPSRKPSIESKANFYVQETATETEKLNLPNRGSSMPNRSAAGSKVPIMGSTAKLAKFNKSDSSEDVYAVVSKSSRHCEGAPPKPPRNMIQADDILRECQSYNETNSDVKQSNAIPDLNSEDAQIDMTADWRKFMQHKKESFETDYAEIGSPRDDNAYEYADCSVGAGGSESASEGYYATFNDDSSQKNSNSGGLYAETYQDDADLYAEVFAPEDPKEMQNMFAKNIKDDPKCVKKKFTLARIKKRTKQNRSESVGGDVPQIHTVITLPSKKEQKQEEDKISLGSKFKKGIRNLKKTRSASISSTRSQSTPDLTEAVKEPDNYRRASVKYVVNGENISFLQRIRGKVIGPRQAFWMTMGRTK